VGESPRTLRLFEAEIRRSPARRSMRQPENKIGTSSRKWHVRLSPGTQTKDRRWSTRRRLDELDEQGHRVSHKISNGGQVSKLKSTYTDALPTYVHPSNPPGHTTHALAATTTGRLSSTNRTADIRSHRRGRKIPAPLLPLRQQRWCSRGLIAKRVAVIRGNRRISLFLKQAFRDGARHSLA